MSHLAQGRFDDSITEIEQEADLEETVRRYDEINAKTMFNMVEESGDQRLFFLTNRQAELLSETSEPEISPALPALHTTLNSDTIGVEPKLSSFL